METVLQAEGEGKAQPQPGEKGSSLQQLLLKDRGESRCFQRDFSQP